MALQGVGRYNVNVNSVGFGFIETRLVQPLGEGSEIDMKGKKIKVGIHQSTIDAVKHLCSLGRAGNRRGGRRTRAVFLLRALGLCKRRDSHRQRRRTILMDPLLEWRKEFPILDRTVYMISCLLGAMLPPESRAPRTPRADE